MAAWRAGSALGVTGAVLALVSLLLPWSSESRHLAELPPAQSRGAVLMLVVVGAGAAFCLAGGRRLPSAPRLTFVLVATVLAAGYLFRVLEVLLQLGTVQGGPPDEPVVVGASGVARGYLLYAAGLASVLLGVAVAGAARVPVRAGTLPWRVGGYRILAGVALVAVVPALSMPWYGIDFGALDPEGPTTLDVDTWRSVFFVAVLAALAMAGAAAWLPAYVLRFRLIGLAAAAAALVFLILGHEWLLAYEPSSADFDELTPDSGLRGGLGASAALTLAFLVMPPGPARRRSDSVPVSAAERT
ncbi:hypothetical protein [Actinoplanes sp. DH11]|uniref:hypothetical protein n=1 Tax=Actinoplanes sp. DH11 TaxID=2857011 RepID=UPI001E5F3201|nr:hypothetical protein [Actinoplanes sp. DH11]